MSLVRKIGFEKYAKVRDAFEDTWGITLAASNVYRIEIVYDSYLEFSIKESTKIGRAYKVYIYIKLINDEIIERDDLKYIEKEAYCLIVLHIASAVRKDLKEFLVVSNDTDVVMYNLAYFYMFKTMNVNKIWVKFGIHERQRYIPVYQLGDILGTEKSLALLKEHILTRCDVTSKIGSKSAAFKTCPEKHLYDFGEDGISLPNCRKVPR